jgi:DNA polymerase epsilon subunit 4
MATEMFIQHLATTTHNVVKAERKPRRNIQYRDAASAVAKTDNLEFLVDVVPKTMTYKEFKKRKEETEKVKASVAAKNGALDVEGEGEVEAIERGLPPNPFAAAAAVVSKPQTNGYAKGDEVDSSVALGDLPSAATPTTAQAEGDVEAMEVDQAKEERVEDSEPEEDGAAMQIEMEMRGPRANDSPEAPRRSGGFTAINGK